MFWLYAAQFPIDLVEGFDVAGILSNKECGQANDNNGNDFTTSQDRKTIITALRPRFQIATNSKKFGIYLGYSFGLSNYRNHYVGGTNDAY